MFRERGKPTLKKHQSDRFLSDCCKIRRALANGAPNDNNPNLVVPIGDAFGFVLHLK